MGAGHKDLKELPKHLDHFTDEGTGKNRLTISTVSEKKNNKLVLL